MNKQNKSKYSQQHNIYISNSKKKTIQNKQNKTKIPIEQGTPKSCPEATYEEGDPSFTAQQFGTCRLAHNKIKKILFPNFICKLSKTKIKMNKYVIIFIYYLIVIILLLLLGLRPSPRLDAAQFLHEQHSSFD